MCPRCMKSVDYWSWLFVFILNVSHNHKAELSFICSRSRNLKSGLN